MSKTYSLDKIPSHNISPWAVDLKAQSSKIYIYPYHLFFILNIVVPLALLYVLKLLDTFVTKCVSLFVFPYVDWFSNISWVFYNSTWALSIFHNLKAASPKDCPQIEMPTGWDTNHSWWVAKPLLLLLITWLQIRVPTTKMVRELRGAYFPCVLRGVVMDADKRYMIK